MMDLMIILLLINALGILATLAILTFWFDAE
jgi:hypothetical protein